MSLPRSLSLMGAVMLVVGNVVGAGIFTTSGMLAGEVSHPLVFIGVWILGGLLTLLGALTYAELGAMFPRAGGDYQFIKEAYGRLAGMLLGWMGFWVIFPGSMAALSIAIIEYVPGFPDIPLLKTGAATGVIIALAALNIRSTRLASAAQSIVTMGSLALLIALVVGGLVSGTGDATHLAPADGQSFGFTGSAMIAVFFTYSGWFAAAYVGSEVINPGKNVPVALILGTIIVTVLYTGVNAVYLLALPLDEMRSTAEIDVATRTATRLFGPEIAGTVAVAIILAIGSCINASVMTGSRLCFAMAEDGLFPRRLGAIHQRFQTPTAAIVAQATLGIGFVWIGAFETLLASVVFAMLLSNTATGIAHLKLRVQRPEMQRPYRTHGYPYLTLVFIAAHAAFAIMIAVENLLISLLGLGIAATAIPFYWRHRGPAKER